LPILYSCSKNGDLLNKLNPNQENFQSRLLVAGEGLTDLELLGKNIFFDKISVPNNMSCSDCHSPRTGFTGPIGGINIHGSVYRGSVPTRFGNRKPPTAAYGGESPVLSYDDSEGHWVGGMFWDGRATGLTLGDPLAEQALGPFLNPVEHNNPDMLSVLQKISGAKYIWLWELVYGEPLILLPENIEENYNLVGEALAAYERSSEVSSFTSKYDYYLKGIVDLSDLELQGLELFNGKGMCSACHPGEMREDGKHPLFTDFTFDNLGTPKNPENPFYLTNPTFIDEGLGGFLRSDGRPASTYLPEIGKQKVPTLRNVDKRPGNSFPKAYLHNGYFKSLKEVVHFYNTRDVESWPSAEVTENINSDELGNLGLTNEEEDAIVAFLATLSDGYKIR
jgi:cytochrome c peroxidase